MVLSNPPTPLAMPDPALRALQMMAFADGDFSEAEQQLLGVSVCSDQPASDGQLLTALQPGSPEAAEFLRAALLVALADGAVTTPEQDLLQHWSSLLQQPLPCLTDLDKPGVSNWDAFDPVRAWLDGYRPRDTAMAQFLVKLIPAQCPFERDLTLFGQKLVHIPPMCKLNPLYDQLVALRFRALCYLADCDG
jgi:hypothetical protein